MILRSNKGNTATGLIKILSIIIRSTNFIMKKIWFSFLVVGFLSAQPTNVSAQTPEKIQQQMKQAIDELKKQVADQEKQIGDQEKLITDAKKNKEDTETIKSMEEDLNQSKQQLAMLKKQVEMMGGVSKSISQMPKTSVKKAIEKDSIEQLQIVSVPQLDKKRIALIPKETLSDAQLTVFVKKVNAEVEKLIRKEDKEEASKIYSAAKALNKSSNAINNIA